MGGTKEEERECGSGVGGGDGGGEDEKQESKVGRKGEDEGAAVPLVALNHVARLCRSIESSVHFYESWVRLHQQASDLRRRWCLVSLFFSVFLSLAHIYL